MTRVREYRLVEYLPTQVIFISILVETRKVNFCECGFIDKSFIQIFKKQTRFIIGFECISLSVSSVTESLLYLVTASIYSIE